MSGSTRTWSAAVAAAVLVALAVLGVPKLMRLTQYGGGQDEAAQSTVVMTVATTRSYLHSADFAAQTLWNACVGNTPGDIEPPRRHADGTYSAQVRPGLAADTARRLVGCLQDLVLDDVRGHVRGHYRIQQADLYDTADHLRV